MTESKTTPWDEGDKATILQWWDDWKKQKEKPESVILSAIHFERILEGAVYEITREI